MSTLAEMEQWCQYLSRHAVLITKEGPMKVQSKEEVKEIIQHHLGIKKHDLAMHFSNPEPFIAIFHDSHNRDIAFGAARIVDDPIELNFHDWDVDKFKWRLGKADGQLDEEVLTPPTRYGQQPRSHPREDDDFDRNHGRSRPWGFIERMTGWMESRGRSKKRHNDRIRYQGESSRGGNRRHKDCSPPTTRAPMPQMKGGRLKCFGRKRGVDHRMGQLQLICLALTLGCSQTL
jgi:hypothetical protein